MVDQNAIYTFTKRGVFYFSRRVPKSLQPRFDRPRIVTCLHTRSPAQARKSASVLSAQLEMVWAQMHLDNVLRRISTSPLSIMPMETAPAGPSMRLSEAGDLYRRLKGGGKGKGFKAYTDRHLGYVVECLGDAVIGDLKRTDAGRFRDFLIRRKLTTTSIKRVFSTVRAAVNLAISEHGLDCTNPFAGIFIPEVGAKVVRPPIPTSVIRAVQTTCLDMNDDKRLLIALISDTGLRLAEALGLTKTDLKLHATVPHVDLKPHPWRSLKTASSTRTVPLVGASLSAAQRLAEITGGKRLFPRYATPTDVNANSASATLNKWIKSRLPKGCVIHSFRHSLRDRLRAVECPADIIDAIGGWTTQGIGHRYGSGHSLEVKQRWLKLIELQPTSMIKR
uniref:Tyrosine-type recombinase/integrase n=1 Tax=Bosea sp. NBC_00436 TaxID=2969620 RepID=A0A9E8CP68_9HYPH